MGAIVIGGVAGVVCFLATNHMKRKLHIDDSLDVFPVHGVGGIVGTLSIGVFAAQGLGGAGFAEGFTMSRQLGVQLVGVLAAASWSGIVTFVLLKIVDSITGLRVSAEQETEGLDTALHNESGYSL